MCKHIALKTIQLSLEPGIFFSSVELISWKENGWVPYLFGYEKVQFYPLQNKPVIVIKVIFL